MCCVTFSILHVEGGLSGSSGGTPPPSPNKEWEMDECCGQQAKRLQQHTHTHLLHALPVYTVRKCNWWEAISYCSSLWWDFRPFPSIWRNYVHTVYVMQSFAISSLVKFKYSEIRQNFSNSVYTDRKSGTGNNFKMNGLEGFFLCFSLLL